MKVQKHTRKWTLIFTLPLLMFWGCEEDPTNPGNGNEQELITTVTLTLTENGTSNTVTILTATAAQRQRLAHSR